MVTLPGLKIEPGKPAINPVPLQMIRQETMAVLPPQQGVVVTISVPGGAALAERTFNPKLGIIGGISILGTKGIEEPMSEEALKESLALEIRMMAQQKIRKVAFVFGNYGERFAVQNLNINRKYVMKIGNFIGFMLEKADQSQFSDILIIGHIGKLVKVAAGIMNTHSRVADARSEILCAYAALEGAPTDILQEIYQCRTTEAAVAIISAHEFHGVYSRIGENIAQRCQEHVLGHLKIGSVLYTGNDTQLYINQDGPGDH